MTSRPTAEIVADLRTVIDRPHLARLDIGDSILEAADRLAELDAEIHDLGNDIENDLERQLDGEGALRERLRNIDALRPPCPTCGGNGDTLDLICDNCGASASLPLGQTCSNHLAKPSPCPDCVDGKVSIGQLAATWRAVWDDATYEHSGHLILYLRAVRP